MSDYDLHNVVIGAVPPLQVAKSVPRICFISGLTGEEMMMFIDAFPESGTEYSNTIIFLTNEREKVKEKRTKTW